MALDDRDELVKLLHHLNSAHLIVPEELTKNLLRKSGFECTDQRTAKLISVAAQKFLQDLVQEARNVQKNRNQGSQKYQQSEGLYTRDKRVLITTEDVAEALKQYGIKVHRPGVLAISNPK